MISFQESVQKVIQSVINGDNEEIFAIFVKFLEEETKRKYFNIKDINLIRQVVKNCDNKRIDNELIQILNLRRDFPNEFMFIEENGFGAIFQEKTTIINLVINHIDNLFLYLIVNERISRPFWKFYFKSVINVFECDNIGIYEKCYFNTSKTTDLYNMLERCLENIVLYNETNVKNVYNFNPNLLLSMIMGSLEKYAKFWYSFAMFYVHDVK